MTQNTSTEGKKKPRSLFHYTTANGLLGIVRDRRLFATHAEFSNDSSECKLILPYLKTILATEYERLVRKLIECEFVKPEILHEYGTAVFEEEAQKSVIAMLEAVNESAPYFIASFCIHDEKDYAYLHGLLSQWRSYARGGFAIEFDEFGIDELNTMERDGWRYQGIITDTVVYDDHEAKVAPSQFKAMAGPFLRTILDFNKLDLTFRGKVRELDDILGTAQIEQFARPFLSVAPFLKHSGFREESEYRIVALCNRPKKFEPSDAREMKEIYFRSREGGNVVPYIALYESLQKPLPIKSVIVGPHARQDNQRTAVELLLERYDINAQVRVSELPFRE